LPSGKQPTTLVLRRISRITRSNMLFIPIRRQCSRGYLSKGHRFKGRSQARASCCVL
jgi:hypothetical protein